MRLIVRALGLDLLDIEISTSHDEPEPQEDHGYALNGGTLGYDRIDAGPTDHYMGFTNGRGDD